MRPNTSIERTAADCSTRIVQPLPSLFARRASAPSASHGAAARPAFDDGQRRSVFAHVGPSAQDFGMATIRGLTLRSSGRAGFIASSLCRSVAARRSTCALGGKRVVPARPHLAAAPSRARASGCLRTESLWPIVRARYGLGDPQERTCPTSPRRQVRRSRSTRQRKRRRSSSRRSTRPTPRPSSRSEVGAAPAQRAAG
jgi:hypothetical protein